MFHSIEQILKEFRPCFSREAALKWFIIVIISLMTRQDHLNHPGAFAETGLVRMPDSFLPFNSLISG